MYEIGRVHIWQNCKNDAVILNGTECTVTGPARWFYDARNGASYWACPTDTNLRTGRVFAPAGYLRPKNPPTGEQKIRSMFEPKPVMEVA